MNKKNPALIPSAEVERAISWLKTCRDLCDNGKPLSPAEKTDFNSAVALEMAKAEDRRCPSPQGKLGV